MTNMNGLTNIFDVLGHHPAAKWLLLALAARAAWTVFAWRMCPLTHGRAKIDETSAAKAEANGPRQMLRFVAVMLIGIALAIGGLFRMAEAGEGAPLALLALTGGIYLFTTEPVRRALAEAQNRVLSAAGQNADSRSLSVSMLRDVHVRLVSVEVGVLALFGLGMTVA